MAQDMMGSYAMDPDQLDLMQLQRKRDLAQQMAMSAKPAGTRTSGILGVLAGLLAGRQMNQADEGIRAAMERQRATQANDREGMVNLATMKPTGPMPQTNPVANDDEGNPMPPAPPTMGESPDDFQARKIALAKTLVASNNPQVANFAMTHLLPQPKEFKTVKPGEKLVDFSTGAPKVMFEGGIDTANIKPKDYTPESYAAYNKSGNPADLRRYDKPDLESLVIMGPDGKPMVNPVAVQARSQVAAAGRAPAAPRLQYDAERGITVDLNTGQAVPVQQGGAPIGPKPQNVAPALKEKLAANNVALANIDKAIADLGTPTGQNAVGFKNAIPGAEMVRQYTDPQGTDTRAIISGIGGQKFHDLSGAAVSVSEAARLKPYIPSVSDTPQTARMKLQNMRREYATMNQELAAGNPLAQVIAAKAPAAAGGWSISRVE